MHDIDRIMTEYEPEMEGFEEVEYFETEGVFDEATEMDLAAEMLSVTDEADLDQFLGNLIKTAGRAVGRFVRSPVGRSLGGILKGAAKQALPVVGGALGSLVAPGVGTAIGSQLAQAAGQRFGLELEGLSPEDQEFEIARRFVRLAGDAVKKATSLAPSIDPRAAAKAAFKAAARKFAPGLLSLLGEVPAAPMPAPQGAMAGYSGQSGRWIRRGRKIVLLGV
jgi:uncharacterized protein (DUF697 family)